MSGTLTEVEAAEDRQSRNGAKTPFPGWEPFLPELVHPLKVAIVEALIYLAEPLSAVQLGKMLRDTAEGFSEPNVRYHLHHLVEIGLLEVNCNDDRQIGDPKQKYFYFAVPTTFLG